MAFASRATMIPSSDNDDSISGDFETAYNWFSSQYADPSTEQPLLSERETKVFSQFLDTVLTDTSSQSRDQVRFLDSELLRSGEPSQSEQKPLQRLSPHQAAQTEFYRGFVDSAASTTRPANQLKPRILYTDAVRQIPLPNSPLRIEAPIPQLPPIPKRIREGSASTAADSPATQTVSESPAGSASADEADSGRTRPREVLKRVEDSYRRKENLSEDQVRKNHIRSEKKRRDSIKQLFGEMCSFVEGLDVPDKTLPKAAILEMVCRHIRNTAEENAYIRKKLTEAGVDTSSIPANPLD